MTALLAQSILPPVDTELEVELELINDPEEHAIRITRALQLPDPTAVVCRVAHAAVEALHGARPVQQLARLVSPSVYEQLSTRAAVQFEIDRANGVIPLHAAARARSRKVIGRAPTRIINARVLRISPTAAEASVVLQDGHRVRAAALRVEEFRGRWRASVLQIG